MLHANNIHKNKYMISKGQVVGAWGQRAGSRGTQQDSILTWAVRSSPRAKGWAKGPSLCSFDSSSVLRNSLHEEAQDKFLSLWFFVGLLLPCCVCLLQSRFWPLVPVSPHRHVGLPPNPRAHTLAQEPRKAFPAVVRALIGGSFPLGSSCRLPLFPEAPSALPAFVGLSPLFPFVSVGSRDCSHIKKISVFHVGPFSPAVPRPQPRFLRPAADACDQPWQPSEGRAVPPGSARSGPPLHLGGGDRRSSPGLPGGSKKKVLDAQMFGQRSRVLLGSGAAGAERSLVKEGFAL